MRLNDNVQIFKGKDGPEFLIVSPCSTTKIAAENKAIFDLIDGLVIKTHDGNNIEPASNDPQASALLNELVQSGVIVNVENRELIADRASTGECPKLSILANHDSHSLLGKLRREQFSISHQSDCNFFAVISNPYDFEFLSDCNRIALAQHKPTFFACTHASSLEIGPLVFPGQSACFECAEQRIGAAQRNSELDRTKWIAINTQQMLQSQKDLFESLIVAYLVRFTQKMGKQENVLVNEQLIFDLRHFTFSTSPIRRLPRCRACGLNDPMNPTRRS